jgi:hypothetical protein
MSSPSSHRRRGATSSSTLLSSQPRSNFASPAPALFCSAAAAKERFLRLHKHRLSAPGTRRRTGKHLPALCSPTPPRSALTPSTPQPSMSPLVPTLSGAAARHQSAYGAEERRP